MFCKQVVDGSFSNLGDDGPWVPCSCQCGPFVHPCSLTGELALGEYWLDVGRGHGVPSSGEDIPAASEGIRFCSQSSRAESYLQVELAEVLGPPCLSPSQFLRGGEVFEVFVVSDGVDGSSRPFQVVSPDLVGLEDG